MIVIKHVQEDFSSLRSRWIQYTIGHGPMTEQHYAVGTHPMGKWIQYTTDCGAITQQKYDHCTQKIQTLHLVPARQLMESQPQQLKVRIGLDTWRLDATAHIADRKRKIGGRNEKHQGNFLGADGSVPTPAVNCKQNSISIAVANRQ